MIQEQTIRGGESLAVKSFFALPPDAAAKSNLPPSKMKQVRETVSWKTGVWSSKSCCKNCEFAPQYTVLGQERTLSVKVEHLAREPPVFLLVSLTRSYAGIGFKLYLRLYLIRYTNDKYP